MAAKTQHGLISTWDDEKGYGFIAPRGGGKEVFVHIGSFPRGMRRPKVGDTVSYIPAIDEKGRYRAEDTQFISEDSSDGPRIGKGGAKPLTFAAAFICLICFFAWQGYLPWLVPGLYASASLIAYLFYSFDKFAAQANQWRVSERTLHGLSLVGGWPGALVGQTVHRHKTKKAAFRAGFWLTVLANCLVLAVVAILFKST